MLHLSSSIDLKEQSNHLQTFHRCCLLSTPIDFLQLLPTIYKACKPLVITAYRLQYLQIFYSCCLLFTTSICPMQPLNLMVIFMLLLPSNCNYHLVITPPSYSSTQYREYIIIKISFYDLFLLTILIIYVISS